jgi:hypothetical protein
VQPRGQATVEGLKDRPQRAVRVGCQPAHFAATDVLAALARTAFGDAAA